MTERGTVIDTRSSTAPISSVRPCHSVSTNPSSSVSMTRFGRKRSTSNRLCGACRVSSETVALVDGAEIEEVSLRLHEGTTIDHLLAVFEARLHAEVRLGAALQVT